MDGRALWNYCASNRLERNNNGNAHRLALHLDPRLSPSAIQLESVPPSTIYFNQAWARTASSTAFAPTLRRRLLQAMKSKYQLPADLHAEQHDCPVCHLCPRASVRLPVPTPSLQTLNIDCELVLHARIPNGNGCTCAYGPLRETKQIAQQL